MCLIGFSLRPDTKVPLTLAANRDEYYDRPTDCAHWWPDTPGIFGGRDKQANGTWLAAHRDGRLAALTNYREGFTGTADRSRGELVSRVLDTSTPVEQTLNELAARENDFAGFNLLVFDWHSEHEQVTDLTAYYLSNRNHEPYRRLEPGVYAFSNGLLDDQWPKCKRLSNDIAHAHDLPEYERREYLLHSMTDGAMKLQAGQQLPDTGVGAAVEQELAPAFVHVDARSYGTRCTTLASLASDATLDLEEWNWLALAQAQLDLRRSARFKTGSGAPFSTV